MNKKTWKEFTDSGFLWWINTILHTFGWAIVVRMGESGDIEEVYPARTRFRGFEEKTNENGYIKVSKYMKENSEQLYKEASDEK